MKREEIVWALVTGASSGIGTSLSHLLASQGINLIVHGRDESRLLALATELRHHVQVDVVVADLADTFQRQLIVDAMNKRRPEVVINNAGYGLYGEALSHEVSEQVKVLDVNGNAVLQLTLEAGKMLVRAKKKGVILNVASAAAYPVFPNFAVYAAAKAFVVHLSESLDFEMRPYGVRVLAACPGMVETNFRQRAGGSKKEETPFDKVMNAEYAANEIWKQIKNEKKVHIFSLIYRFMTFFVLHVLPKKWVAVLLRKSIDKRYPPSPRN